MGPYWKLYPLSPNWLPAYLNNNVSVIQCYIEFKSLSGTFLPPCISMQISLFKKYSLQKSLINILELFFVDM